MTKEVRLPDGTIEWHHVHDRYWTTGPWDNEPLCAFQAGLPRDWPKGHAWVSIAEFLSGEATLADVNCTECKARLSSVKRPRGER